MNLNTRKISRFRTHIDPMIGGTPKNAFDKFDIERKGGTAHFEMTPAGVYVKLTVKTPGNPPRLEEHVVPYSNVQSIMLEPSEEKAPRDKEEG